MGAGGNYNNPTRAYIGTRYFAPSPYSGYGGGGGSIRTPQVAPLGTAAAINEGINPDEAVQGFVSSQSAISRQRLQDAQERRAAGQDMRERAEFPFKYRAAARASGVDVNYGGAPAPGDNAPSPLAPPAPADYDTGENVPLAPGPALRSQGNPAPHALAPAARVPMPGLGPKGQVQMGPGTFSEYVTPAERRADKADKAEEPLSLSTDDLSTLSKELGVPAGVLQKLPARYMSSLLVSHNKPDPLAAKVAAIKDYVTDLEKELEGENPKSERAATLRKNLDIWRPQLLKLGGASPLSPRAPASTPNVDPDVARARQR